MAYLQLFEVLWLPVSWCNIGNLVWIELWSYLDIVKLSICLSSLLDEGPACSDPEMVSFGCKCYSSFFARHLLVNLENILCECWRLFAGLNSYDRIERWKKKHYASKELDVLKCIFKGIVPFPFRKSESTWYR